jgi:ABC-type phosphate/phosphonate transport system ATPase subunit
VRFHSNIKTHLKIQAMTNLKSTLTVLGYLIAIAISVVVLNNVLNGKLGNKETWRMLIALVSLLLFIGYFISYCLKLKK